MLSRMEALTCVIRVLMLLYFPGVKLKWIEVRKDNKICSIYKTADHAMTRKILMQAG